MPDDEILKKYDLVISCSFVFACVAFRLCLDISRSLLEYVYTVKIGVLQYTFAMVFWDTFMYSGVT